MIQYWKLITLQMEHGKWTKRVLSKLLVECTGELLYKFLANKKDLDMDINWIFYLRITMIDEMLLFNRHDEINLDALKIIKEKKRYKMDKIKKHFNFQTLEDPTMSPSAEMTKFMTNYLTGIVFISSI